MQRVFAVCGVKNSGKTTLITKLVRQLSDAGLKAAVIKHDGHDFTCDIPDTDTWKYAKSGAYGTACYSGNRMFLHRIGTGETYENLIGAFPEADVIIIEGAKDSALPKIEVIRKGVSDRPVSNPKGRILIATDHPAESFAEPTAGLDEIEKILKITGINGFRY